MTDRLKESDKKKLKKRSKKKLKPEDGAEIGGEAGFKFMLEKKPKKMNTGGVCKGAGAAIKGTKFEGVF